MVARVACRSCTIKVCERTPFYNEPVFHMHIDGKIGLLQRNNQLQKRMNRLLFSIVADVVSDEAVERRRRLRESELTLEERK